MGQPWSTRLVRRNDSADRIRGVHDSLRGSHEAGAGIGEFAIPGLELPRDREGIRRLEVSGDPVSLGQGPLFGRRFARLHQNHGASGPLSGQINNFHVLSIAKK